jgi:hypothetical protein
MKCNVILVMDSVKLAMGQKIRHVFNAILMLIMLNLLKEILVFARKDIFMMGSNFLLIIFANLVIPFV